MAGTLPSVRGGAPALYPVRRTLGLDCAVVKFMNGKEQRWIRHAPLNSFELRYAKISTTDIVSLNSFIVSQKGMFDSTWSITLDQTYSNLGLDSDSWTIHEDSQSRTFYSISLRASQTQNAGALPTVGSSYPALASGALTCYPYERSPAFRTLLGRNENGPRYATAYYGAGLSGFPGGPLNNWLLSYVNVSDSDLSTYVTWFLGNGGCWKTFAFADPDNGNTFSKVRIDQPSLEIDYQQKNASSFSIKLAQIP